MKTKIYLSHFLSEDTPGYGGNKGFFTNITKNMCCGDSCNQQEWKFTNHIGTHIDCPKHFDKNGKSLSDYPAEFWFMQNVCFLEITIEEDLLIDLKGYVDQIDDDCEFLIIKTGFCNIRDQKAYWESGPGLKACSGKLLRELKPNLKAIGFDFISLTSFQHREEGRSAHKAFLHSEGVGNPILIVEDMDLTKLNKAPENVVIAPLLVTDADGAQVTVLADI